VVFDDLADEVALVFVVFDHQQLHWIHANILSGFIGPALGPLKDDTTR
jgi:hypothetical protein